MQTPARTRLRGRGLALFPAGNHSEMTPDGGTGSHPTPPAERKKPRNKLTQRGPSWWRGKSIAVLKLKPLHKLPLICASLLQISFKSASLCWFIYSCCFCCLVASDQIRSVAQSCPTLWDPMNRSTPGLPVHHQLPEFTQTHVHRISDAIQPSHPLSSPSPPAPNQDYERQIF